MEYERIKAAAAGYLPDMTRFLRAIVRTSGTSCHEEAHAAVIADEMRRLSFDKVEIDEMGNVLGFMGTGSRLIAFDAHIDTVGVGNPANWSFDPFAGFETADEIGGRGTSDQLGGIVSAVYGVRIMADLGLIPDTCRILVTGTVQEEDCDGLCWEYLIKKKGIRPEFVVSTEPTDGGIYRGQRGRMEIRIDAKGISSHGSAPERGDNAIYKIADILRDIRALNDNSAEDEIPGLRRMLEPDFNAHYEEARFLGPGTVTASEIFFTSPSRCAVADSCSVSLDRRMSAGETWQGCIEEIRNLPHVRKYGSDITVSLYRYERPSYTGLIYPIECYFPTWVLPADHVLTTSLAEAYRALFGTRRIGARETLPDRVDRPLIDKWTFSTNGVSIMGRNAIPCIGFGPGAESRAHAPDEKTWKQDLTVCAALYAALPATYVSRQPAAAPI